MENSEQTKTKASASLKRAHELIHNVSDSRSSAQSANESRPDKIIKTTKARPSNAVVAIVQGNNQPCTTFHRFGDLVPELQIQIYQHLLPTCITQCKKGEGEPLVSIVPLLGVNHSARAMVKELMFMHTEFEYVIMDPIFKPKTEEGAPPDSEPNPGPLIGTCATGHLLPLPPGNKAAKLLKKIKNLKVTFNFTVHYDFETLLLLHDRLRHFMACCFSSFTTTPPKLHVLVRANEETYDQAYATKTLRWYYPFQSGPEGPLGQSIPWTLTCEGRGPSSPPEEKSIKIFSFPEAAKPKTKDPSSPRPLRQAEGYTIWDAWHKLRLWKEHIEPQLGGAVKDDLGLYWNKAIRGRQYMQTSRLMEAIDDVWALMFLEQKEGRLRDEKTMDLAADAYRSWELVTDNKDLWPKPEDE